LPVAGLDFNEFIGKMSLDVKRQIISQAMKRTDGNKTRAARLLGLSRSALGRQLEKIKNAFE
jgi:DNA-binding NtrC family response regulator